MAAMGYNQGGFGYIELTYDEAAALAAATEYYTDEAGNTYPLLAFTFTYTGTQADGTVVTGKTSTLLGAASSLLMNALKGVAAWTTTST